MFAGDANLFLVYEGICSLFQTAKLQLERINQWFIFKTLSLNVSKKNYSLFHTSIDRKRRYPTPFTKINDKK